MTTFVPTITTPAGGCLTRDNWQALGIDMVSCALDSLLMKPGFEALSKVEDLKTYVGWDKDLVLDATMLRFDKEDRCTVQSTYDGARTQVTLEQFWALVQQLRPTLLLLPEVELIPEWSTDILPFFPVNQADALSGSQACGLYLSAEEWMTQQEKWKRLMLPLYLQDDKGMLSFIDLDHTATLYYASEKPAADAYEGTVYQVQSTERILDDKFRLAFEPLDPNCACPTCLQKCTGAYLHHLLQHTPLLCQRLLILHNIYFFARKGA
ncbi:MAG: queuine tRNA-ribosyltransferase family protein [Gammaproteobacteria bacterium]|nr:queuine tRNA-ribosyltransferase family protein [Gammaproteobacteria bacterium]